MKNYISNTLVHWTGRGKNDDDAFDILKKIVDSQLLYLSYCPNYGTPDVYSTRDSINDRKTMMVCFTDLPLNYSKEFCLRFGKFGIGFNKDKMMEYGANPVLYTTDKHLGRIKEINTLINKLLKEEVDREWKSDMEHYQFKTEQLYSLLEVFGFTQEYKYKNIDINYYQREWRINYETLPVEPGKGALQVGYGGMHGTIDGRFRCEMKYSLDDIDYLIMPKSYCKRYKKLNNLLKIKIMIYEVVVEGKWWKKFI